MISRTSMHFFFGLSLILCTLNLSVQCWSSDVFFAEINEEIEQVLEEDLPIEVNFTILYSGRNTPQMLSNRSVLIQWVNSYQALHFFEIDSPPPEVIAC